MGAAGAPPVTGGLDCAGAVRTALAVHPASASLAAACQVSAASGVVLRFARRTCATQGEELAAERTISPVTGALIEPIPNLVAPRPDYVCYAFAGDLRCDDLASGAPVEETLVASDDLAALLEPGGVDGLRAEHPALDPRAADAGFTWWSVAFFEGRVFGLVSHAFALPTGGVTRTWRFTWLVERAEDGHLAVRLGPSYDDSSDPLGSPWPLRDATRLVVHDPTRTLFAWRSTGALFRDRDRRGDSPPRADGLGLPALDLDDLGTDGYLEVSRDVALAMGSANDASGPIVRLLADASGDLVFATENPLDAADPHVRLHRLDLDAAALDLDHDGLPRTRERELGTSDARLDSDGGGVSDPVEALLRGTDPTTASDDLPADFSLRHGASFSSLIQLRIPFGHVAPQPHASPFVCLEDGCYDAAGRLAFAPDGDRPAVSGDGRWGVYVTAASVRRRDLASGAEVDLAPSGAAFAALGFAFDPATPSRHPDTLATNDGAAFVAFGGKVARLADGAVEVLWDLATLECEAGLGPCSSEPDIASYYPPDRLRELALVGDDPTRGRLFAWVRSDTNAWLVVLEAGRAPVVVMSAKDFPTRPVIDDTSYIDSYLTPSRPLGLVEVGRGLTLTAWEGRFVSTTDVGLRRDRWLQTSFPADWGLSGGFADAGLLGPDGDVSEVVPTDAAIQPGDVVLWERRGDAGAGPAVSGPRGGSQLLRTPDPTLTDVRMTGAGPGGALCAVDALGEALLFDAPDADGVPTRVRAITVAGETALGAVHCTFDADGRPYVLTAPRTDAAHQDHGAEVVRFEGDRSTVFALPGVTAPRALAVTADGALRVVELERPLACFDPRTERLERASFVASGVAPGDPRHPDRLWVTDAPGGRIGLTSAEDACWRDPEWLSEPRFPGRLDVLAMNLAERPDGRLALQYGLTRGVATDGSTVTVAPYLFAFDPELRREATLAFVDATDGFALVPGGSWCDPWQHLLPADVDPCALRPVVPPLAPIAEPEPDAGPTAEADAGAEATEGGPARGNDDSCAGGPGSALPLAALAAVTAARRRATRARRR